MNEFVQVGKTKKTYGVQGAVKVSIEDQFVEDVLKIDVAFLKIQGKLLPYFIESFDFSNHLLVKFEDIDSPEAAVEVTSKAFYVKAEVISNEEEVVWKDGDLTFGKLIGFSIQDETFGTIGKIEEILAFPQQEMAEVSYQDRNVMIPLNQELITTINESSKIVVMNLPEGLLDL